MQELATLQTEELHGAVLTRVYINNRAAIFSYYHSFQALSCRAKVIVLRIHTCIRIQIGYRLYLICLKNTRNITFLVFLSRILCSCQKQIFLRLLFRAVTSTDVRGMFSILTVIFFIFLRKKMNSDLFLSTIILLHNSLLLSVCKIV